MAKITGNDVSEITCLDSVFLVSQQRDAALNPQEHERLKTHLAACPRCRVAKHQFHVLFQSLDVLLGRPNAGSVATE